MEYKLKIQTILQNWNKYKAGLYQSDTSTQPTVFL